MEGTNVQPGNNQEQIILVQHDYEDYADKEVDKPIQLNAKGGVKIPFPIKLYRMLEHIDLHNVSFQKYVSWQPHGRAFRIHDIKGFKTHVQPYFFGNAQYTSFRRQLNLWGFKRLTYFGPDQGSYYHQMFLRTKTMLCHNISRTAVLGLGQGRLVPNPNAEPNFYEMRALPETSEAPESKYIPSFGARNKKQMRQGGKRKNDTREMSSSSFQNIKMPRLIQCSEENLPRGEDHKSAGKHAEEDLHHSFQEASRRLNVLASEYSLSRHTITRPTHDVRMETDELERITPSVSSLRRSSLGKSYDVRVVSGRSMDTASNSSYITKETCNYSNSNMFLNSNIPSSRLLQLSQNHRESAPSQKHSSQKDSAYQDPQTKCQANMTRIVSSNDHRLHDTKLEDSYGNGMADDSLSVEEQREWNSFFTNNPARSNASWNSHLSKYFHDVARYTSDDDNELERIIARSEEQNLKDIEPYTGIPPPLSREEKEQFKSLSSLL